MNCICLFVCIFSVHHSNSVRALFINIKCFRSNNIPISDNWHVPLFIRFGANLHNSISFFISYLSYQHRHKQKSTQSTQMNDQQKNSNR